MKRLAALLLCLLVFAAGCRKQADSLPPPAELAAAWPENQYTQGVPQPGFGQVERALLDEGRGYCAVWLSYLEQGDAAAYQAALEEAGFAQAEAVSEEVAGQGYASHGLLYTNGEIWVSLAYLEDDSGSMALFLSRRA